MTRLLACLALLTPLVLASHCGDGDPPATPGGDADGASPGDTAAPDADVAGEWSDGAADAADTADTADAADALVPPALHCAVVGRGGPLAEDETGLVLVRDGDEPADYLAVAGLQVDVRAEVAHAPLGAELRLFVGGALVGSAAAPSAARAEDVTLAAVTIPEEARFAPVELSLRLVWGEATLGQCDKRVQRPVFLCDASLQPGPAACLTADVDPNADGLQLRFYVTNPTCGCTDALLTVRTEAGESTTPAAVLGDACGAAIVVTVDAASDRVNSRTVAVVAHVQRAGMPSATAATEEAIYRIDTDIPAPTVDWPPWGARLSCLDDTDPDRPGIQGVVQGRCPGVVPADGAAACVLQVAGVEVATTGCSADGTYTFGDVPLPEHGDTTLHVRCVDGCGQSGVAQSVLTVAAPPGRPVFAAPADGARLCPADDGDPATAVDYESLFQVCGGDLAAGARLQLDCRRDAPDAPWWPVGALEFRPPAGTACVDVPVSLPLALLAPTTRCRVLRSDEAPGCAAADERTFALALPAPWLALTAPPSGPLGSDPLVVAGRAAHLSGTVLDVEVLRNGQRLFAQPAFATATDDGFSGVVELDALGVLSDGAYTVCVAPSNAGGCDVCQNAASSCCADFQLLRSLPELTFLAPDPAGDLDLDPALHPDVDPATAGYQTAVRVRVAPVAAAAEVCLSANGQPVGCAVPEAGSDTVLFPGVTLSCSSVGADCPPDAGWPACTLDNRLAAQARNGLGVAGPEAVLRLDLRCAAPGVRIEAPLAGTPLCDPRADVRVAVSDPVSGGPLTGASVTLFVNGSATPVPPVAEAGGRLLFSAVPLRPGPNELQAQAERAGTVGVSAPVAVTVKTAAPALDFVVPAPGEVVNLATAACNPAERDCLLDVLLAAGDIEPAAPASLTVDCGSGPRPFQTTVGANGQARFGGVQLPHGQTCVLEARATDVCGLAAGAGPVSVLVDRRAPRILSTDLPESLLFADDQDLTSPGVQYPATLEVAGVEAGQTVDIELRGSYETVFASVPVTAAVSDDVVEALPLGMLTIPAGTVTLTFSLSDAAGNAVSFVDQLVANTVEPSVWIQVPAFVPRAMCRQGSNCAAGGICAPPGLCAVGWGISAVKSLVVNLIGVPAGSGTVRVCTDNPGQGSAPCSQPGAYVVTRADYGGVGGLTLDLDGSLVDGAHALTVEAELRPGEWVSSLSAISESHRRRHVFQDTLVPAVTEFSLPANAAPVDWLSAAEQAAGGGFLVRIRATEEGSATVFDDGGLVPGGVIALTGGPADAVLPLGDGLRRLTVRVADVVGNQSPVYPPEPLAVTVDTAPPSLAFAFPNRSPILAGDPRDVVLTSDAAGRPVTLYDGPVALAAAPVDADSGSVAFAGALSHGVHAFTARVSDLAGNVVVAETNPATVVVDTLPPTVELLAPAAGAVLGDGDDADPARGYQVRVRFRTAGAARFHIEWQNDCDPQHTGCGQPLVLASGALANPEGLEPDRVLTVPLGTLTPTSVLTVEVSDENGNRTAVAHPLTLALGGCTVAFTDLLPAYGNAFCEPSGVDCPAISVPVSVRWSVACDAVDTVELRRDGAQAALQLAPETQLATFWLDEPDGAAGTLEVVLRAAGVELGRTGEQSFFVDLAAPEAGFVATTVDGFVTPAEGSFNVYNAAADRSPAADLQIHAQLHAADGGGLHAGGQLVSLVRVTAGVPTAILPSNLPLPHAFGADPALTELRDLSFPQGGIHTLLATVGDRAGNTAVATFDVSADFVAPALVALAPLLPADVNRRRPAVTLRWTAVGDDATGGAAATAYDIRYSFAPITADTFEAACRPADIVGLDGTAPLLPAPAAPGTPEAFTLSGPDVRDPTVPCWLGLGALPRPLYVAIVAFDEVGNRSALAGAALVTTPELGLRGAEFRLQDPPSGPEHTGLYWWAERVVGVGDVDGDGLDDVALRGRDVESGADFCILYGHAAADPAGTLPSPVELTADFAHFTCSEVPRLPGRNEYVAEIRAAGDMNGDGFADVLATLFASGGAQSNRVYLGSAAGLAPSPALTLAGIERTSLYAGEPVGNFDGDVHPTTGRPLADIVLGADRQGVNTAFVVLGSAQFDTAAPSHVDLSTPAGWPAGLRVVTIVMQGQPDARFGWRAHGAGNVLPDPGATQYADVAVTAWTRRDVTLIKGRPIPASTTLTIQAAPATPPTGEDAQVVRLEPTGSVVNFGRDVTAGFDADRGGTSDLAVTSPSSTAVPARALYVFRGEALQTRLGQTVALTAGPGFGDVLVDPSGLGVLIQGPYGGGAPALVNLDDDPLGLPDLLTVLRTAPSHPTGHVFLRLNVVAPEAGFDVGEFGYATADITYPLGAALADSGFGASLWPIGDFNGDGLPDVAVGWRPADQTEPGYIVVLH